MNRKKNLLKLTLTIFVFLGMAGIVALLAARQVVIAQGKRNVAPIIAATQSATTPDETVIALTRAVATSFHHQDSATIALLRLRPILTNRRLPTFVRLPDGVLESFTKAGLCDNAARLLAFSLAQKGYKSEQWNMVTPKAAHSALLVHLPDGRKILADPFFGFVTVDDDGALMSPQATQDALRSGKPVASVFHALGTDSDYRFYDLFAHADMGAQGADVTLNATLPKLNGQAMAFGSIDGKSNDVRRDTMAHDMNPFWDYIGHKYDRHRTRVLTAQEPVTVAMTLLAEPEDGIFATFTPAPVVSGKTLTWTLNGGEALTFKDGLAKVSLKRLNSYIEVDQITVSPQ